MYLRNAALGDSPRIYDLLEHMAPEIPLLLDTCERREAVEMGVRKLIGFGESFVAIEDSTTITDFPLLNLTSLSGFSMAIRRCT
jgi:hypothetical protein